jgi:hypothetical protein
MRQLILFFAFTSVFASIHDQIQVGKFRILTSTYIDEGDTVKLFEKEIIEDTVRRTDNLLLFKQGYYSWNVRNDSIVPKDSRISYSYFNTNGQLYKTRLNEPYNETWDISNSFDTLYQNREFTFYVVLSNKDTIFHRYVVSNIDTILNLPYGVLHTTKLDYNYSLHSINGDSAGESFQMYYEPFIGLVSWRDAAPSNYQLNLLETNLTISSSEERPSKNSSIVFTAYPNPSMRTTSFIFKLTSSQNILLNLYDISGKLVKTIKNGYVDNTTIVPISLTEFPHGKYIAKLKHGNSIKSIIITH